MISFLFWNLNGKRLHEKVARLVSQHRIDVLMLAECEEVYVEELLSALRQVDARYSLPMSQSRKIRIFTRFQPGQLMAVYDEEIGRLTVRRLTVGKGPDVLLAVVHFPSKVRWERDDQSFHATQLANDILGIETDFGHGHRRTILVGDLNMDPFDPGVVSANGLHAVMDRAIASESERVVQGRNYPFFYNPMWEFFGDRTRGSAGTYFFRDAKPVVYFWHILDQVLLRPELMNSLHDVEIVNSDGIDSLLYEGRPDSEQASDHLPILFRMDL